MCFSVISISFLEKCVFSPLPIVKLGGLFIFLLLTCKSSLYILDIIDHVYDCKYFSHSVDCLLLS